MLVNATIAAAATTAFIQMKLPAGATVDWTFFTVRELERPSTDRRPPPDLSAVKRAALGPHLARWS